MNTLRVIALCLAVLTTNTSLAAQSDIDAIEQAFYHNQLDKLEQIEKSSTGYDHYFASYRLGLKHAINGDLDQAKTTMEQLIVEMESYTKENPEDAESLGLLAYIYGYTISLEPMKAQSYGPLSHSRIAQAQAISPDNPRVLMFKGVIEYNTPAMYGGSKHKAVEALSLALEQFPSDLASGKHWGHSEANVWLGLSYLELGQREKAREHWQAAVDLNAENAWARGLLEQHQQ
ncbi:Cytochrome c biogenesis factor [Alteromonadaceae bacterium Bs31]|nr:Cytochrome c biogenesis factor [Alteromonadaceae bacterium Bs31]